MKTIKLAFVIYLSLLIVGCKTEKPNDIEKRINEYEQQIQKLNNKIDKLRARQTNLGSNKILVEIDTVKYSDFVEYISVTANIEAENYALISPQMNGQVTKVYVYEGQRVKKGTQLIKLNDDVLQRNLAQLQTSLLLADTLYQKQKMLYEQNVISQVQFLQAKNQKETIEKNIEVVKSQINQTNIIAPFDGIVDKIDIKEGEIATPGKPILQLVNLSTLIARTDISEKYIPYLKIGDNVVVSFSTYPDIIINSNIFQMGNIINPSTRTFWIKVKFNNVGERIKPNMLANLRIKVYEQKNVIKIPSNIISKDINGHFVYVAQQVDTNLVARKTYIGVGHNDATSTIITSGLKKGDLLVTKGFKNINDNSQLKLK